MTEIKNKTIKAKPMSKTKIDKIKISVAKTQFEGFMDFVRAQGVVGLAVGFILGGAVSRVVASLVDDIIDPILGIILGSADGLAELSLNIGTTQILWGSFLSVIVDFIVIALVVYYGVKGLGLDKLDKKKSVQK